MASPALLAASLLAVAVVDARPNPPSSTVSQRAEPAAAIADADDDTGDNAVDEHAQHLARLIEFQQRVTDFRHIEARLWGPAGARRKPRSGLSAMSRRASPLSARELALAKGATDADCLAQAIYYEARSEPQAGQAAVAQVVMNRTRSGFYPTSVCGVVFQGAARTGCQFSFACDGSMRQRIDPTAWGRAREVAGHALDGSGIAPAIGPALNYHADYVHPTWAQRLMKVAEIGRHIFYQAAHGIVPPGGAVDPAAGRPNPASAPGPEETVPAHAEATS